MHRVAASLLVILLLVAGACHPARSPDAEPAERARAPVVEVLEDDEEPLLLLDDPLLLEDPDAGRGPPDGPVADNERCHVCHLNLADEELVQVHARANVSCEDCHGSCDAHCSDEDNITPPDVMFPRGRIDAACGACHGALGEDHDTARAAAAEDACCTDCHGEHRLSHRTRLWDRESGELLEDDRVRMMTDEMLRKDGGTSSGDR